MEKAETVFIYPNNEIVIFVPIIYQLMLPFWLNCDAIEVDLNLRFPVAEMSSAVKLCESINAMINLNRQNISASKQLDELRLAFYSRRGKS